MAEAPVTGEGRRSREREVRKVSRLEVQAARLRLVTDAKQGKTSPSWVRRLANARDA